MHQAILARAARNPEAAHQMTSNRLPPGLRKPRSVGAAAGPEVGIMDPTGRLLLRGETGEVVIRGPNVTRGYENVLRDGAALTEREARDAVAARLAPFKVPKHVVFVAEIPKGATGKLRRIGLARTLGLSA